MTRDRIEKALKVIEYAINKGISVTKASKDLGHADTYVKNVKQQLPLSLSFNDVSQADYDRFMNRYNQYELSRGGKETTTSNGETTTVEFPKEPPRIDIINEETIDTKIDSRGDLNINFESNHIKTLEQLLKVCEVDEEDWFVKSHIVNKWDVSAVIDGSFVTHENFQVKAQLERNRSELDKIRWQKFVDEIRMYSPNYKVINDITKKEGILGRKYLLEMSIFDLHVGKLAWDEESGENYDTKIAINRYNESVSTLLEHVLHYKDQISEILFPLGNDLINVDNKFNKTTAGTDQHVDSRWQQMFRKTKELMIRNIDILSQIAPVKVLMVSGNHDQQTVFYLGEVLDAWYHGNGRVIIDNNASQRKYHRFGTNLIGFTHGNEEKHLDLPYLMSEERRVDWAETKYREIHLGHFHKRKTISFVDIDENRGAKIRVLPSLSGSDAWHNSKGYKSMKSAVAFLYDKEKGMIAEFNHNILN
ncbi:MAG: hypothetical protein HC836_15630 [Richelia sp. RM2_1_2]|nr:hypothetical protein [Richelia sp. RM2_1_2]